MRAKSAVRRSVPGEQCARRAGAFRCGGENGAGGAEEVLAPLLVVAAEAAVSGACSGEIVGAVPRPVSVRRCRRLSSFHCDTQFQRITFSLLDNENLAGGSVARRVRAGAAVRRGQCLSTGIPGGNG